MGGDDEGGQHPFTFNLAFGPAVQTLRASTRTVHSRRHTDTSVPHARRSTVGSAAVQGLRICSKAGVAGQILRHGDSPVLCREMR
jgi:hypothetical protein